MYLKLIKIAVVFISIALVSPLIKYQPDVLRLQDAGVNQKLTEKNVVDNTSEIVTEIPEEIAQATEPESEPAIEMATGEIEAVLSNDITNSESCIEDQSEAVQENESESLFETGASEMPSTMIAESEESIKESVAPPVEKEQVETAAPVILREETAPTETMHSHIWVPITEIIHHEAIYDTIHHPEVTEMVWIEDVPAYDEVYEEKRLVGVHDFCKGCGIDLTTSGMSFEEYEEHESQHLRNGDDASYYSAPVYEYVTETIHHEAEGHYEDRVVKEAYDEEVLKSESWDEEVVKGYHCSECGTVQ